jgi:hypothetical protein
MVEQLHNSFYSLNVATERRQLPALSQTIRVCLCSHARASTNAKGPLTEFSIAEKVLLGGPVCSL